MVLSAFAIWMRSRRGLLLTGVSGLFMSATLFLGLGPICYLLIDITWEQLTTPVVSKNLAEVMLFLSMGFIVVFIKEFLNRNKISNYKQKDMSVDQGQYLKIIVFFFILSLVGYFLSQTTMANSGIGTFFPVFRLFLYPSLIMAVYQAKISRPLTVLIALLIIVLGFYLTLTSIWRSQLILFFGSIAIGLLQRSSKYNLPVVLGVVVVVLFLLPFQHLKKIEYTKVKSNLALSFNKTLELSLDERLGFTGGFFAERINYGREIAYANNAINKKWVSLRNGETYAEMVLQIIPRSLWPNKPSYNYFTNYYLARRIGLVAEDDDYTSWGVNVYAEFIMNFNHIYLILFIPILFGIFSQLDKVISSWFKNPNIKWITGTVLFFIAFEMVGIVNVSTFIIWMLLVAKAIEIIFRMRLRHRLSVPKLS